jgi:hypothetical protein
MRHFTKLPATPAKARRLRVASSSRVVQKITPPGKDFEPGGDQSPRRFLGEGGGPSNHAFAGRASPPAWRDRGTVMTKGWCSLPPLFMWISGAHSEHENKGAGLRSRVFCLKAFRQKSSRSAPKPRWLPEYTQKSSVPGDHNFPCSRNRRVCFLRLSRRSRSPSASASQL